MAYEKIKLSDIEKIDVINTKGMTAEEVYAKYKPDYMLNGALYDVNTGTNIVKLKDNGATSGYLFADQGIGILNGNKPVWCKINSNVKDYIAGAPTLVINGVIDIDWGNKHSEYIDGNHKRSVLGFNGTHLYLLASDYNNTIKGLANYCVQHGMTHAINLDGGGSCHLQKGKTVIKKSTRANASWILVYLKKTVSTPEDVTKANRDIKSLQPIAQQAAQLFLDTCKVRGIDIFVTEYHRSQARQDYLYEQGRTKPGKIVTWTRSSNHTSGYAWDIAVNPPNDLYDKSIIARAGEVARELGIEWGGDWKEQDTPHFQIDKNWKAPVGGSSMDKQKINLNGVIKEVEVIKKDGNNFVKLQDLRDDKIIVGYDEKNKLPVVKVVG